MPSDGSRTLAPYDPSIHLSLPQLSVPEKPMSTDLARKEFHRACTLAKIPKSRNLTPHSMRGGAATAALSDGVPQAAVMSAGRWRSANAFDSYIEPSFRTFQGAANIL